MRLNRTSVGLKPGRGRPPTIGASPKPQSNQRGIETQHHRDGHREGLPRLNRTSVGLKHCGTRVGSSHGGGLNRTSVGLKLEIETRTRLWHFGASIEPAWD